MKRRKTGQRVTVEKKEYNRLHRVDSVFVVILLLFPYSSYFSFRPVAIQFNRVDGARAHAHLPMRLCVSFVYCYNQCQSVCAFEHLHAISIFENVLFPLFSIFNRINSVLILQTGVAVTPNVYELAASSAFSYGHSVFVYAMPNNLRLCSLWWKRLRIKEHKQIL